MEIQNERLSDDLLANLVSVKFGPTLYDLEKQVENNVNFIEHIPSGHEQSYSAYFENNKGQNKEKRTSSFKEVIFTDFSSKQTQQRLSVTCHLRVFSPFRFVNFRMESLSLPAFLVKAISPHNPNDSNKTRISSTKWVDTKKVDKRERKSTAVIRCANI